MRPTAATSVDFKKGAGSSVIEKSEGSLLIKITMKAGHYSMLCFIQDRTGSLPHLMKGLLTEIVIKWKNAP